MTKTVADHFTDPLREVYARCANTQVPEEVFVVYLLDSMTRLQFLRALSNAIEARLADAGLSPIVTPNSNGPNKK